MNAHLILHPGDVPYPNNIDEDDWDFIKDVYGKGDYPHMFGGYGGDNLFTTAKGKEARAMHAALEPVVDIENVLTAQPNIEKKK